MYSVRVNFNLHFLPRLSWCSKCLDNTMLVNFLHYLKAPAVNVRFALYYFDDLSPQAERSGQWGA